MFGNCNLLISLPDISKWDISNITTMGGMFGGCSSLISLPDISKWKNSNRETYFMFDNTLNCLNIPFK